MKVSFVSVLHAYSTLFQEKIRNFSALWLTRSEQNFYVLSLNDIKCFFYLNAVHFSVYDCITCHMRNSLLTNLDELLFLTVLAFPNASRSGLDFRITSFTCCAVSPPPETADKYSIMNFAATVLPAPDSPL